jgi:hypothetical protein
MDKFPRMALDVRLRLLDGPVERFDEVSQFQPGSAHLEERVLLGVTRIVE